MLKEFKKFAVRGNLVDIAAGFVMGVAFKQVVTSFTAGIVSPLIGLLFKASFNELKWVLKEDSINENGEVIGEVAVLYGNFLTNIIDFIIVALVMFVIIKGVNKLKKKEEPEAEAPAGPSEIELLMEIRDALKK